MSSLTLFGEGAKARVYSACIALQQGNGVILMDDADGENEGDLIFAATHLTTCQVRTLIQDCSGIICLTLIEEKSCSLSLEWMVKTNTSANDTAFTESIEAKEGVSSGVSAHDRLQTIKAAIHKSVSYEFLRDSKADFFLVDVREPEEYAQHNLGGYLIPLKELPDRVHELDPEKVLIVHCKSGVRFKEASVFLLNNGFNKVTHLQGGLIAWINEQQHHE